MALTPEAIACTKEAVAAIKDVSDKNRSLLTLNDYGDGSRNGAQTILLGHIGNLAFDECMVGATVLPNSVPAKAPQAAKTPAK